MLDRVVLYRIIKVMPPLTSLGIFDNDQDFMNALVSSIMRERRATVVITLRFVGRALGEVIVTSMTRESATNP